MDEAEFVDFCLADSDLWIHFDYRGWERWGATELQGMTGVPDVVLAFGRRYSCGRTRVRSIALEVKLHNWKRALAQAFRYASFTNYAYVVVPFDNAAPALKNLGRFAQANVGLITVDEDDGQSQVFARPKLRRPYSAQLRRRFESLAKGQLFTDRQVGFPTNT